MVLYSFRMSRCLAAPIFLGLLVLGGSFVLAKTFGNGDLPEFLQRFDTNNDEQIDEEERQAIRDLRSSLRRESRQSIDTDEDGEISPQEIAAARETIRVKIAERRRRKFRAIAGEDDLISPAEYAVIPGIEQFPPPIFDAIWEHLALDGDGTISLDEFLGVLRHHE